MMPGEKAEVRRKVLLASQELEQLSTKVFAASQEWGSISAKFRPEAGILQLARLGERLGMPCRFVLEGQEREHERSYLGFGQGWPVTGKYRPGHDPLEELREFLRAWRRNCQPCGGGTCAPALESGLIGYFDYEWGLVWQKPRSTAAAPSYFFRACPVNIIWLPKEDRLVLEVFAQTRAGAEDLLAGWGRAITDFLGSAGIDQDETNSGPDLKIPGRGVSGSREGGCSSEAREIPSPEGSKQPVGVQFAEEPAPPERGEPILPAEGSLAGGPRGAALERQPVRPAEAGGPVPGPPREEKPPEPWRSNMDRVSYLEKVRRIQEFIRAGDIFQGVFSQRFSRRAKASPWRIYERLRLLNPSPYMFYLEGEKETLVGSSPELLVSTLGKRVITRPIAGTRPRGPSEAVDKAREKELRLDAKENAEHAMLVDLGRNDIGRVAGCGSVKVSQYAKVERFSHVMHLVSTVEGELRRGEDGLSALKAVFPAGTLSGAPKVRAMEILQELEPERRGAYGGALGIARWNGDVDFCITIRTLQVRGDTVNVQAGGGIVYDSQPEREYAETLQKAMALMKAVDEVVDGDR